MFSLTFLLSVTLLITDHMCSKNFLIQFSIILVVCFSALITNSSFFLYFSMFFLFALQSNQ